MNRPNILLISLDSLRADAVSSIGEFNSTTPFLDDFASRATFYDNAFSQGIWTVPSHTSIFSGLYPTEHRIYLEEELSTGDVSLGDHPTLPERAKEVGYETKAFYRLGWLESDGVLRGFPSNTKTSINDKTSLVSNIDQLLSALPRFHALVRGIYRGSFRGHMPDEDIVGQVIQMIKTASQPFCYFVHLNDAHWPYSPSKPFHNMFSDRSFLTLFWNRAYSQNSMFPRDENSPYPSDRTIEIMKELYLGAVRQVDNHLHTIFTSIPGDILEDTIIIIFGDHGEAFGEKNKLGHNDIIPEVAHVPLLIRDPTGTLSHGRVQNPVELIDIYPTIGRLTGIDLPSTNANDLTERSNSVAFTHASKNEHDDLLLGKYAAWKSPTDYLIWDAIKDETDCSGRGKVLKNVLNEHLDTLHVIPPRMSGELGKGTIRQLRNLGYLG